MPSINCKIRFSAFTENLVPKAKGADLFLRRIKRAKRVFEYGVGRIYSVLTDDQYTEYVTNTDLIEISPVFTEDKTYWYYIEKRSSSFTVHNSSEYLENANFIHVEKDTPLLVEWHFQNNRSILLEEFPQPQIIDASIFPRGLATTPFLGINYMHTTSLGDDALSIRVDTNTPLRVRVVGPQVAATILGDEIEISRGVFVKDGQRIDTRQIYTDTQTKREYLTVDSLGMIHTSSNRIFNVRIGGVLIPDSLIDGMTGAIITSRSPGEILPVEYMHVYHSNSSRVKDGSVNFLSFINNELLTSKDGTNSFAEVLVDDGFFSDGFLPERSSIKSTELRVDDVPILIGNDCQSIESIKAPGEIYINGVLRGAYVEFDIGPLIKTLDVPIIEDPEDIAFAKDFILISEFGIIDHTIEGVTSYLKVYSTTNYIDVVDITADIEMKIFRSKIIIDYDPLRIIGVGAYGFKPSNWIGG
jgi:hypothetical protein